MFKTKLINGKIPEFGNPQHIAYIKKWTSYNEQRAKDNSKRNSGFLDIQDVSINDPLFIVLIHITNCYECKKASTFDPHLSIFENSLDSEVLLFCQHTIYKCIHCDRKHVVNGKYLYPLKYSKI